MGEAKRRAEAGTFPERKTFVPGPIQLRPGDPRAYVWIEPNGHVRELRIGARISDDAICAHARAVATEATE